MFQLAKLFNLACAPNELKDDDQLQPLKSATADCEPGLLCIKVGEYAWSPAEAETPSLEITSAEFLLHQWLLEQGASKGETIFVNWQPDMAPANSQPGSGKPV